MPKMIVAMPSSTFEAVFHVEHHPGLQGAGAEEAHGLGDGGGEETAVDEGGFERREEREARSVLRASSRTWPGCRGRWR